MSLLTNLRAFQYGQLWNIGTWVCEWAETVHAAVCEGSWGFDTLFALCSLLLLRQSSKLPTSHTGVYELSNKLAPTNDPKFIGSKVHLSLTSTLMTSLGVIVGHNQLSDVTERMTGCFTSRPRDDCLNLPPTWRSLSDKTGSRQKRELEFGRSFSPWSNFISWGKACCWTSFTWSFTWRITPSAALSRSSTVTYSLYCFCLDSSLLILATTLTYLKKCCPRRELT